MAPDHIYNYLSSVYTYDDQTLVFMHVEMTSYLQIIHGLCPRCFSFLLQQYHPQRSLRSSSKLLFTVRTVNSVTYGERAFSFSASISHSSLRDSCDIGFRVQFNAEFTSQVMNFLIEPIFIEPSCQICKTMVFFVFYFPAM